MGRRSTVRLTGPGFDRAYVDDPFGNPIELPEPASATIGGRG